LVGISFGAAFFFFFFSTVSIELLFATVGVVCAFAFFSELTSLFDDNASNFFFFFFFLFFLDSDDSAFL
jgi:hypothetical protein